MVDKIFLRCIMLLKIEVANLRVCLPKARVNGFTPLGLPGNGRASRVRKEGEPLNNHMYELFTRDTMVITWTPRKHTLSSKISSHICAYHITHRKFLSPFHPSFKEDINTGCCSVVMAGSLIIQVIISYLKPFLCFPTVSSRRTVQTSRKEVLSYSESTRPRAVKARG